MSYNLEILPEIHAQVSTDATSMNMHYMHTVNIFTNAMKARWITWNNKTNAPTTSDTLNGIQMVLSKQQRSTALWKSNARHHQCPPPPLSESMIDPTPFLPLHYCDPHSIIRASAHIHFSIRPLSLLSLCINETFLFGTPLRLSCITFQHV